jgi:hypothetical protein
MNTGIIKSMLLLDEPNLSGLRHGIENSAKAFLAVSFIGALSWEFLTEMKFMGVVKNLVLALVFMGCFYEFHTKAVDLSFKASEELLREVSPRNIFLRKWAEVKVKTSETTDGSSKFNFIEKFAIPNLNDLLGTALFLLSKICILILKLIYTTVYHFTYIFAPITAILSFIPTSKNSMAGTVTSSLWCILLPFVLVVFLAMVGNSIQIPAENGQLAISSMDQLIWIFGITLLMLLVPSFTFMLIKGSVASTADAIGVKMTGIGAKALISLPLVYGLGQKIFGKEKGRGNKDKKNNFRSSQNSHPYSRKYSPDRMPNINSSNNTYQRSLKDKGGMTSERPNQSMVKLSEMKTNDNIQKQNSIVPNLSNPLKSTSKDVSSKIPSGSFNLGKNTNQLKSEGIMKNNSNSSANSNFFPKSTKSSQLDFRQVAQTPMQNSKNIIKQDHILKRIATKSKFERFKPVHFRKVIPKERFNEV